MSKSAMDSPEPNKWEVEAKKRPAVQARGCRETSAAPPATGQASQFEQPRRSCQKQLDFMAGKDRQRIQP